MIQGFTDKAEWVKNEDGTYFLLIDDNVAEILSEKVQYKLALEGFDCYYNITPEGKSYERLVDKFSDIGW